MKELLIIGARGYGREVSDWAKSCVGHGEDFIVKGFLDDDSGALDGYGEYPPILGPVETHAFACHEVFVVALGDPAWKRHYAELAIRNGGQAYTLVHKSAFIGIHSKIGIGCLISANARISVNCEIGDFVAINAACVLGHDAKVGNYCHLGVGGFMGGHSKLGACVAMHPRAMLLPGKQVGDGAILGAGSVCIKNVKPGKTVFGIPAREFEL